MRVCSEPDVGRKTALPPVAPASYPMARSPSKKTDADLDAGALPLPERYEDALAELEGLVARMESGALPLEQLLDSYRRGAQLLGLCRSRLDAIEAQVKVLEDGQLKPWSEA
jgi:exodeoxyribonuclease VII small subunit